MKHKIIWKDRNAYIGKIRVGSINYAMVAKGDPAAYDAHIELPGMVMKGNTRFSTAEAAMARVDNAVASWFAFLDAEQ